MKWMIHLKDFGSTVSLKLSSTVYQILHPNHNLFSCKSMVVLVTYDLNKQGKNYADLFTTLESMCTSYIRPLKSVWMLDTQKSIDDVSAAALKVMDPDDRLYVTRLVNDKAGWLTQAQWDWLNSRL